ncbi:hypothetical protein HA402_007235 [Bradysia odoriphaga]|nr:hypothetical protein HA402_007235 [Bradysia odoriphaga]
MRILLIVLMYNAATTYAGPLGGLLGGSTNNRPRYGLAGGSSNSGGLLGTGSSGGFLGGLLGAKPSSAPSKLPPIGDYVENVIPVRNVPYPNENVLRPIDGATKLNIGDVAATGASETLPDKDEPLTSLSVENVSPPVNDVESVTVSVEDVTKTSETPIVDVTDALPTNSLPLNDLPGAVTNSLPTVGSGGGSSGGLLAQVKVTQALPIGGDSGGLLGNLVGDVTNIIGDLTKILPVGGLLGGSNDNSVTGAGPLGNVITAPCAIAMLFLTSLLPSILPFLTPIIETVAPLLAPILAPLAPSTASVINQSGPAILPIIKPLIPHLVPVYLRLLPHFIAATPEMVPSLLEVLLGAQNLLPAVLPAP